MARLHRNSAGNIPCESAIEPAPEVQLQFDFSRLAFPPLDATLKDICVSSSKLGGFELRSNRELLELLLRSTEDAEYISRTIPIHKLDKAHRQELGLLPDAFQLLQASIELGRRVHESKTSRKAAVKISSTCDATNFCQKHFSRLIADGVQEQIHVITLDTKNQVIASHLISVGTLDASLAHPREIFRPAIKDAASSIILVHNHPSGDPTPSREDIALTDRLTDVGEIVGIDVLDHIVLGKEECVSIREFE